MNSLPKTVTRQRRGCDLNPGPSAPESSMLTTRLLSHPVQQKIKSPFDVDGSAGCVHVVSLLCCLVYSVQFSVR